MALRGISTSDWHLQAYSHIFADGTACRRQFHEIAKPYDAAVAQGIRHMFVAGDLSNVPKLENEYLIALTAFFLKYPEIITHYLVGNHDYARIGKTSVDVLKAFVDQGLLPNVRLYFEPTVEKIEGVYVTFMPFPYNELPEKRPTLLFAHVESPGALGDNGYTLKCREDKVERIEGDFMISGHLHTYQHLKNSRTLFNGSLTQRNFGESLPKGYVQFEAKHNKSNGNVMLRHEFVNSRPEFTFNTVEITSRNDWAQLSEDPQTLYRLFVDDGVVVPADLTRTHPNVISMYSSSKRKKVEKEEAKEFSAINIPSFKPTTGLLPILKKHGLDKKQLRLAKSLVNEAMNQLGYS